MTKKPLKRKRAKKSNSSKLNALKKTASMRGYKLVKKKAKAGRLIRGMQARSVKAYINIKKRQENE